MQRLRAKSQPTDLVTVRNELTAAGNLPDVRGGADLPQILKTVPHASHGPHYVEKTREIYERRKLVADTEEIRLSP